MQITVYTINKYQSAPRLPVVSQVLWGIMVLGCGSVSAEYKRCHQVPVTDLLVKVVHVKSFKTSLQDFKTLFLSLEARKIFLRSRK